MEHKSLFVSYFLNMCHLHSCIFFLNDNAPATINPTSSEGQLLYHLDAPLLQRRSYGYRRFLPQGAVCILPNHFIFLFLFCFVLFCKQESNGTETQKQNQLAVSSRDRQPGLSVAIVLFFFPEPYGTGSSFIFNLSNLVT